MVSDHSDKPSRPDAATLRAERLKAALKANMARRKSQARARAGQGQAATDRVETKNQAGKPAD